MDAKLREEIKQSVKKSLHKYVSKFEYTTIHPLDLLIPKERKVRSIIGGLETSIGTTVWEPIAKTLARNNGFEVIEEKILMPEPMPQELAAELAVITSLRENTRTWISADECKKRLRTICNKLERSNVTYIPPAPGTGVDVLVRKNGRSFAFDTKTVQPNLGSIKGFNKEILEWYAYSLCKDPTLDIECRIAYPYNPYKKDFWTYSPHNKGVLKPGEDALVENEFWDFLSGFKNTYQVVTDILSELNDEGFGKELSAMIEKINMPALD